MSSALVEIEPVFCEMFIPGTLESSKLYISERYGTAVHRCACGCGTKVVTPLGPTKWTLTRNLDNTVSLSPSVSNYQTCKTHYLIRNNRIVWC